VCDKQQQGLCSIGEGKWFGDGGIRSHEDAEIADEVCPQFKRVPRH
jgi:hypothetical protein